MILKLRKCHRRMWFGLVLGVGLTLFLAIWSRRRPEMMDRLPPALTREATP